MINLIQTLTKDCNEYGELDASYSNRCPANYLEFSECPFTEDKYCEEITEKDWIKVISKELDKYKKEA